MAISFSLIPVNESDKSFLVELYTSSRAEETAAVLLSDKQKQAFLQMPFDAQNLYYHELYPTASFEIIKSNNKSIGRFSLVELAAEIRIIVFAFLPQFFDKDIFVESVKKVLQKGQTLDKPMQIYLESSNRTTKIFADKKPVNTEYIFCGDVRPILLKRRSKRH